MFRVWGSYGLGFSDLQAQASSVLLHDHALAFAANAVIHLLFDPKP